MRTLAIPNLNALVAVSKDMQAVKLLQQNPRVLNWGCRLMQVVLYNGCKKIVVVVVIVARITAILRG